MMIFTPKSAPTVLRSALALGLAALLALGLSACSSTAKTPPSAARPGGLSSISATQGTEASSAPSEAAIGSPCALVTASEVTAATGKPMGQGNNAGAICSFSATSDPSVVVYVQIYGDAQSLATPKLTFRS